MTDVERALRSLEAGGLLLVQDKALPCVVALVTGDRPAGSWWAHPRGRDIFRCLSGLQAHPDVLTTKLVAGKVTLVHRRLWPAVLAVARARDGWQTAGLPRAARTLWDQVGRHGGVTASGPAAKEVERRLLARGGQEHTEAGRHETRLEAWPEWAERVGCAPALSAAEGRAELEAAVVGLGGSITSLPWHGATANPSPRSKRPR